MAKQKLTVTFSKWKASYYSHGCVAKLRLDIELPAEKAGLFRGLQKVALKTEGYAQKYFNGYRKP